MELEEKIKRNICTECGYRMPQPDPLVCGRCRKNVRKARQAARQSARQAETNERACGCIIALSLIFLVAMGVFSGVSEKREAAATATSRAVAAGTAAMRAAQFATAAHELTATREATRKAVSATRARAFATAAAELTTTSIGHTWATTTRRALDSRQTATSDAAVVRLAATREAAVTRLAATREALHTEVRRQKYQEILSGQVRGNATEQAIAGAIETAKAKLAPTK